MLDAYRDLIDELLGTPTEIRGAVEVDGGDPASPETLRLIAEMRDRDRMVLERIQTIRERDMPYLKAEQMAATLPDDDLPALLDAMELARGDLISFLMNLTIKDWQRAAIHETAADNTLADEVERHVEFDEAQRGRLRELGATP